MALNSRPFESPSWGMIIFAGLIILEAITSFVFDNMSWGWVIGGFLIFATVTGLAIVHPLGARISAWYRNIGTSGHAAILNFLVVFAITIWVAKTILELSITPIDSFVTGGLSAVAVIILVQSV